MSTNELSVSLVVVTFNRQRLLEQLLHSISKMESKPSKVIIVNNASTDDTASVMENWRHRNSNLDIELIHLITNTGGAGGFKTGIERALKGPEEWIWVMDDDVVVLPNAIENAKTWASEFDAFMGQRLTPDGDVVNWSHLLSERTGLAPLVPRNPFGQHKSVASNSGCFEGMFISRKAILGTGLPDSRFFITWDDATYGWLLSRKFRVGYVEDVFLQRTIEMKSIGPKSFTVYSRNDLGRYYFIRNRGIQAKYFKHAGSLNKFLFSLGTSRVVAIEVGRVIIVERNLRGLKPIFRAMKDLRSLNLDQNFPIPEPDIQRVT